MFFLLFDLFISFVVVMPLSWWAIFELVWSFSNKKNLRKSKSFFKFLANTFKQLGFRVKLLLFASLIFYLMLVLFPEYFSFRGKLDAVTWIGVFFPPLLFIVWSSWSDLRERFSTFWKNILWVKIFVMFVLSLVLSYSIFVTSENIIVRKENLQITDNEVSDASKVKLILVSDIHMGPLKQDEYLQKVVERLNSVYEEESKDGSEIYLLLLGDFIASEVEEADYLYPLGGLDGGYRGHTYAVLGNHDYKAFEAKWFREFDNRFPSYTEESESLLLASTVESALESYGIDVLKNEVVNINDELTFVGIDSVWAGKADVSVLDDVKSEENVVVLVHNPDIFIEIESAEDPLKLADKVDLVVAGHTHNGENRLPSVPFVFPEGLALFPIPVNIGQKYSRGYFEYPVGGTSVYVDMYITSGVGVTGTEARLFNPPEIVVLE